MIGSLHPIRTPLSVFIGVISSIGVVLLCSSCAPKNTAAQSELRKEWSAINIAPGSTMLDTYDLPGATKGLIGAQFQSAWPFEELREFYIEELGSRQWVLKKEHDTHGWGRDLGGRELVFCKGAYSAHLSYAGERSNTDWTYALGVGWGKAGCLNP